MRHAGVSGDTRKRFFGQKKQTWKKTWFEKQDARMMKCRDGPVKDRTLETAGKVNSPSSLTEAAVF